MERFNGCEVDVFHTGNETVWCFEVRKDGKLIGESHGEFDSRDDALKAGKNFARWYYA